MTADMNELIRRSAGRGDPRLLAEEAIAAAEAAGDAKALRERIAEQAGIPAGMASRLQGGDAGALAEDAKVLAEALSIASPQREPTMDDLIRGAAGRGSVEPAAEEPPPVPSMDGGARMSSSSPGPSMTDQIRGAAAARAQLIHDNALDFEHARR